MTLNWKDDELHALGAKIGIAQIVYAAMCASALFYVAVGCIIARMNSPFHGFLADEASEPVIDLLRYILWVLDIAALLPGALVFRKLIMSRKAFGTDDITVDRFSAQYLRQAIIVGAIAESAAIHGLVLFLLGGAWGDLIGLAILALAYKAILFPTATKALGFVDALRQEVQDQT